MSHNNTYNYESTFTENLAFVQNELKGKNIIYSVQYIYDEETQIDGDGPQSNWSVEFLSIEKTDDDFIFHTFSKNDLHSYSYPYFVRINKTNLVSIKLSCLKIQVDSLFEKSIQEISGFISRWESSYANICKSNDSVLLKELISISSKIDELKVFLEKKYKESIVEYQRMIESPEYKAKLEANQIQADLYEKQKQEKYQKQEDERLKRCINAYGEVEGKRFWGRL
jgi:hypothetical protein